MHKGRRISTGIRFKRVALKELSFERLERACVFDIDDASREVGEESSFFVIAVVSI